MRLFWLVSSWVLLSQAGKIDDCCCNTEQVDQNNKRLLHDLLLEISQRRFFRIVQVAIDNECQFWEPAMCGKNTCNTDICCVGEECDDCPDIPEPWRVARIREFQRSWNQTDDMWVPQERPDMLAYVDLTRNPVGYTGYKGEDARKIWGAIYNENCFHSESECTEERVFFRLISGFHTETSTQVTEYFKHEPEEGDPFGTATIGPHAQMFRWMIGNHPDRVKNLYFTYVFLLRALNKISPVLHDYSYDTGDQQHDRLTTVLVRALLESDQLQGCSPESSFDETILFQGERIAFREQMAHKFRNISRIIDCVGCAKCKLHAKVGLLGLGTAMKVMFARQGIDATGSNLQRNEIIALMNTVHRFSHAVSFTRKMIDDLGIVHESDNDDESDDRCKNADKTPTDCPAATGVGLAQQEEGDSTLNSDKTDL